MPLLETKGAASAQGFGGAGAGASGLVTYIEDVFSTYLYTGNGSTQTITNGIDLSGKGGLVWIKGRSGATDHALYDTTRGATKDLVSNSTAAETTQSTGLTAFSGTGFSIGALAKLNTNAATYVSWTFRKQAKFFDVVTYTGNAGSGGRSIAHSLGSVPGCIIVKATSGTSAWSVWHRGGNVDGTILFLDTTAAGFANNGSWFGNGTSAVYPTSTDFTIDRASATYLNRNGVTYVAYLFAHNAGGFGLSGTDNVISCGSYTGNGSATGPTVTLGYEPQWLMIKNASGVGNWNMIDNMRGMPVGSADAFLEANTSDAEATADWVSPTATGFNIVSTSSEVNTNTSTYIYIAIRRGPMKVPTSGTSVFSPIASSGGTGTVLTTGFPVDMQFADYLAGTTLAVKNAITDRLRGLSSTSTDSGAVALHTSSTNAEDLYSSGDSFTNTTFTPSDAFAGSANIYLNFRRAPGFFDVVCYTGTGSATTFNHNLSVVPEMMIIKRRNDVAGWRVWSTPFGATDALDLNTTSARYNGDVYWGNAGVGGLPSSSIFSVGTNASTNGSGSTYVAYLFATVAGVSKVGSYTGTGSLQTINCGFTGGARFVLIKRTDSTGDWYVYDSARGISSGNDPYLFLNSTAAEVTGTNYVDTTSVGFQVTAAAPAGLNANGGSFIFFAVA